MAGADSAITCTYTNTPIVRTLKLVKTWAVGSVAGNAVTITTTGGANAASVSSSATALGNTTSGTAVNVLAGDVITLPVETFSTGLQANYSTSIACTGNATALTGSSQPQTLTVAGADSAITCTYTNTLAPKKIDVAKAAGVVTQVSALSFQVPYTIVVKNTDAATQATNVQISDNLSTTFAAGSPVIAISTPAQSSLPCTINSSTYNGTSNPNLLAGTNSLAAGASCTITFTARVTYPNAAAIPVTPQNNTATAGVYASAPGAGGVPTGAPLASDNSSNGSTPVAGDTPGATPVSFVPQKIDVVKAVGVPKQIAPKIFEVSYSLVVANVCKSTPLTCASTSTVFNVQVNDNLSNTFPTASSIAVSNYAVTSGASGAICTPAAVPYKGTAAASALLSGVNDLAGGQSCIITFKATVDFGAAAVPTAAQGNLAYASGVGSDTTVNPGYSYSTTGVPVSPAGSTTTDTSTSAPATSGAPGTLPATPVPPTIAGADSDSGLATAVVFAIQDDGVLSVRKSTVTKIATSGDVVEYSVTVTNSSSSPVKTKVTDTPPTGFEFVPGSAKVNGIAGGAPIQNGAELIFDIGNVPANSSVELRYQMKLGDNVVGGDASNCVGANGTNTLTGTDKESAKSCASVIVQTGLFLEKRANVTNAELGDSIEYSLRVKSVGGRTNNVTIADSLPLGFKLIEGTVRVIRASGLSVMVNPAGSPGPALNFIVGSVANKEVVEIRYRVRLGIGSDLGDGINRAQAKAPFATSSLVASAKVLVTRGAFTREACVVGKVYLDCNQNGGADKGERNGMQDKGELGIPGVRLYMEDGTNITTDENGQYSICGIRAITHVMQVDTTTMPLGSVMGITSNRNLGDGVSLMMNIKAGELYRADFNESSCTPAIMEEVEQRRLKGVTGVVPVSDAHKAPPAAKVFDSKLQELTLPPICETNPASSVCATAGGAK